MRFDLGAYLTRIGLQVRPAPNSEGLCALHRAHRQAIPFENLDVLLGRGIAIDSARVFDKLVSAKRGGYCFEHNRLFADALSELGFVARPLLARVWLGATDTPPLTHTLSLVTIGGQDWIADAGFGGSDAPPMPLVADAEARAPDGALFRLVDDSTHGWMLLRRGNPATTDGRGGGSGFQPQYSFRLTPVADADLTLSNHWTSSAPGTRFLSATIVSLILPAGFAGLTDLTYRRHEGGEETTMQIASPRLFQERLSITFGIDLSADEVAALHLF